MLKISHLSKSYGSKVVLSDLSVCFEPRRIHGILGPNGCGKTTLVKSLLGLVQVNSGNILLNFQPVNECYDRISWLPQNPEAPENSTPFELFNLIERLRGKKACFQTDLINTFHFKAELEKPLGSLSGGNWQKCFLIGALMFDVPLIILDEPTVGLDPISAARFKGVLKERSKEATILLISHITSEIEQLSDCIHFLQNGSFVFSGTQEKLFAATACDQFEGALIKLLERHEVGCE